MNPIRKIPLHVLMLAGLLAVPAAKAADEKSAKPEAKAATPAAPEARMVAYAGINVATYNGYLRDQEPNPAVPDGIGLYVGFLDPEGPAAGKLQEKDVLTRLDDQVLVNAEQFRALLQTRKPGDTVKVVRVRGDDVDTVELALTGRPAQPARPSALRARSGAVAIDPSGNPAVGGVGGIRIMINGQEVDPGQMVQGGAVRLSPGAQGNVIVIDPRSGQLPSEARKMLEDMRKRGLPVPPDVHGQDEEEITVGSAGPGAQHMTVRSFTFGTNGASSTSSSMYSDSEGTVNIRKEGEKKFAIVKDAEGKALFEGEITTEEQLKAQAESIRSRIALADGGNIRIPGMPGQQAIPDLGSGPATSPKPEAKKKPKRDPHEGA